jgi:hypothetical protein
MCSGVNGDAGCRAEYSGTRAANRLTNAAKRLIRAVAFSGRFWISVASAGNADRSASRIWGDSALGLHAGRCHRSPE